jgi:hypothetical protein
MNVKFIIDYSTWGEETIYTKGCECSACKKLYSLIHPDEKTIVMFGSGGWNDPRRMYHETDPQEFLKRVPDGILQWPEDHKPPNFSIFR